MGKQQKKNKIKSGFVFTRAVSVLFAVEGDSSVKNPAVGRQLRAGGCLLIISVSFSCRFSPLFYLYLLSIISIFAQCRHEWLRLNSAI